MTPTLEEIKTMAYKAGEILRAGYGQVHQVEMKGLTDPVTETDKRSEEYLVSYIKKHYPNIPSSLRNPVCIKAATVPAGTLTRWTVLSISRTACHLQRIHRLHGRRRRQNGRRV